MTLEPETLVDHLGHTVFAVEREGFRVWIDPIVARQDLELRTPVCPEWYGRGLDGAGAVFLSHGHDDHLHPPSLLGIPESVPVYFLDEAAATCSCDDDPRVLLARLGFRDLRPFRAGDRIRLQGGITVEAVPAEASCEGEEQACFLVETPDVVLLDAVDIKDAPTTREALARRRGDVDLAFVPTGAALQWQGFWNQMDPVEAVEFCRWLRPKRVASCGGSLSLAEKPRPDTLERYPVDAADWLHLAGQALPEQLFPWRPPVRLHYRDRALRRFSVLQPSHLPPAEARPERPRALLAAAFTGYDPRRPTRRACRSLEDVGDWLRALQPVRDALAASRRPLLDLLKRCELPVSRIPAALLAPSTLRHLLRRGEADLAARLCTLCPPPVEEAAELECTFFEVAEAVVSDARELDPALSAEIATCLWIDRWSFRLFGVHARLRRLAKQQDADAAALRERHLEALRATLRQRRPRLGTHHFRLDAERVPLLTGEPSAAGQAGLVCFPSPRALERLPLSRLEWLFLDLCDGRTGAEVVETTRALLDLPAHEVETALADLLERLTRASVLLVDWSAA